jgi:hypothetical protein
LWPGEGGFTIAFRYSVNGHLFDWQELGDASLRQLSDYLTLLELAYMLPPGRAYLPYAQVTPARPAPAAV